MIAKNLLREQDRLVLNEFNSSDAEQLRLLTKNGYELRFDTRMDLN